ncbi:MAG TPA: A24 family peptidase [Gammaproteobacteria bacterium]
MELFALYPAALFILAVVLGLVVGSFLNVVAYRLPIMLELAWREQCAELAGSEPQAPPHGAQAPPHAGDRTFNLWWPPSACPSCGTPIAPWHNIPVLSFLWLRGKCASCGHRISPRYPIVEGSAALAALVVAYVFGPTWQTAAGLLFTWTLLALTLIDLDHKLLPDSLTQPLLWAGLLLALFTVGGAPVFADLRSSVIGAAAGYLILWGVYHLFKLLTGKEGMGYGDFKLLAAIGAWLGWQMLPLVILLSAAVGSVVGIGLIVFKRQSRHEPIPFGPYLAGAGWIAMLWGEEIVRWYERGML